MCKHGEYDLIQKCCSIYIIHGRLEMSCAWHISHLQEVWLCDACQLTGQTCPKYFTPTMSWTSPTQPIAYFTPSLCDACQLLVRHVLTPSRLVFTLCNYARWKEASVHVDVLMLAPSTAWFSKQRHLNKPSSHWSILARFLRIVQSQYSIVYVVLSTNVLCFLLKK